MMKHPIRISKVAVLIIIGLLSVGSLSVAASTGGSLDWMKVLDVLLGSETQTTTVAVTDSEARFVGFQGPVEFSGDPIMGPWSQVTDKNMPLPVGVGIRTGRDAQAVIQYGDKAELVMDQETEIVLTNAAKEGQLKLVKGQVLVTVETLAAGEVVAIGMSQGVATGNGASFVCDETSTASVVKVLSNTASFTSIHTGRTVTVNRNQLVSATARGLAAPTIFSVRTVAHLQDTGRLIGSAGISTGPASAWTTRQYGPVSIGFPQDWQDDMSEAQFVAYKGTVGQPEATMSVSPGDTTTDPFFQQNIRQRVPMQVAGQSVNVAISEFRDGSLAYTTWLFRLDVQGQPYTFLLGTTNRSQYQAVFERILQSVVLGDVSATTADQEPFVEAVVPESLEALERLIIRLEEAVQRATTGRSAHPAFLEELTEISTELRAVHEEMQSDAEPAENGFGWGAY